MKQFWLGMTSKITEMRDKLKDKMQKKHPETSENGLENPEAAFAAENGDYQAADAAQAPRKKEFRPRMPGVVSASSLEEDETLAAPGEIADPAALDEGLPDEPQVFESRKPFNFKKFIVVLLLLIIFGGAGGVFYYISNIDWNQHKDKIAAQFSEITGKKIVFNGPVHLTLLPSANLTAEDVKIFNPDDTGGEPLASIRSLVADLNVAALVKGDFDVKMMSLVEPDVRFETDENGKLNWESPLSEAQKFKMENMQIVLDSVMIKNAKLSYVDAARDINLRVDNLNAEIIAQSIFGPYRIEGTYMKDNNPEGFAFSIGKISSGLATTLNLVVNQPATETFVRFDGAVMAQNNAVNGNLIFESKKLMNFINSNFNDFKLDKEYDYPLAVSLEVKTNKTKVDFTSFVVKYGETAGAGNLLIPLSDGEFKSGGGENGAERPKVELAFNFTELNMDPVVALMKKLFARFNADEANYNPEWNFDLLADMKSIKTRYRDQLIKEFKLSLDMINNNINIRELSAVLPGDTAVNIKGDVYSDLGHLSYKLDTSLKSDEFLQTLKWLDLKPELNSDTALRRISVTAALGGNFQKIGINPLELSIDKSSLKGEIGIINAARPALFINVSADMINFDNYLLPMPKDIADGDFETRMNYRMQKLGFLKGFDADLRLNLDLGIYESMPFENTKLTANLKNGVLDVKDLSIAAAANAAFDFKGEIKGFGESFAFENLKYDVDTKDFSSFLSKLDIKAPDIDMKTLKSFNSKGIATGSPSRFAIKAVSKLENINVNYGGQVAKKEGQFVCNGDLEVRSPDFVKMLNAFNVKYEPKAFSLGQFSLKTKFAGSRDYFSAKPVEINVGPNNFNGSIDYDATQPRKKISADMEINRFELDKFFYNDALVQSTQNVVLQPQGARQQAEMWQKPVFDKTKLNYAFYETFDFDGKFKVNRLSYADYAFDFATFGLSLAHSQAKLEDFQADFRGGKITAAGEWNMVPDNPTIQGNIALQQYKPEASALSGSKYGFSGGELEAKINFEAPAASFDEMYAHLNASFALDYKDVRFEGWNISEIYRDILVRQTSDGLTKMIKDNLQKGSEQFENIRVIADVKDGKYTLYETQMQNGAFIVTASGSGDINNWDTDTEFTVKFRNPDYLPEFKYRFSESLSAPVLSVDAEALAAMYNKRQAEIEAQNEAAAKAARDRLVQMMNDELQKVKATESELHNVIRSEIESRSAGAEDPEAIEAYKQLAEQVKNLEAETAELQLKGKTPDFEEALVQEIAVVNDKIKSEGQKIRKAVNDNHIKNLRFVINKYYANIIGRNNEAKKIAADYRTGYADLTKRLSRIETTYRLVEDKNIKRLRNKIEGNLLALDNMASRVQNDMVRLQGSSDIAELEKYAGEIKITDLDSEKYVPSIQAGIDELVTYADGRIKLEENLYRKKKEQEEIRRKLEENTGTISVKDTGVSKTVVRDIEEIEKSEQAVDNKNVKVLDFSDEEKKTEANKVINADKPQAASGGVVKKGGGIVVKPNGTISKASGVIIKK